MKIFVFQPFPPLTCILLFQISLVRILIHHFDGSDDDGGGVVAQRGVDDDGAALGDHGEGGGEVIRSLRMDY